MSQFLLLALLAYSARGKGHPKFADYIDKSEAQKSAIELESQVSVARHRKGPNCTGKPACGRFA